MMTNRVHRIHREWFQPRSTSRKSCPGCRRKLPPGEHIWIWGEYVRGKWRTVQDICVNCWRDVVSALVAHRVDCGCDFELCSRSGHARLPDWMKMPVTATPTPTCEGVGAA